MTKLEQLIKELCPDGVEYIPIGSIITKVNEKGRKDKSILQVYVVSNSQGLVKAEDFRKNVVNSEDTSNYTVIRKGMFAYNPSRLNIGSIAVLKDDTPGLVSPMYVVFSVNKEKVIIEYFEYIIKSSFVIFKINSFKEEGARFRFDFSRWSWIKIPIPPIEIQKEIVKILNDFIAYNNLLQKELTARKKQYEYYRDMLLDFRSIHSRVVKCEWRTLKEIAENCDSKRKPVTKGKRTSGIYPYYGASGIVDYIDDYLFDGDYLLISEDGANLLSRVTPIAFSISGKNWVNNHAHVLHFNSYVTRRFVEIYLNSINLEKYISAAAQPKLTQDNLNKIPIPYPTIEEQERIVSILDRFDKLCNDISEGLPAEIEARRKQYEYYRDKLLSFEEVRM